MIVADFLTPPDGKLLGFRIAGHSGTDEQGRDIVCAAVSSAAYLTVNTLTDEFAVTPLALRVQEGELFFRIEPKDEPVCRPLIAGLKAHLTELEQQYTGAIQVGYCEI